MRAVFPVIAACRDVHNAMQRYGHTEVASLNERSFIP